MEIRLITSDQTVPRVASRLQCSVASRVARTACGTAAGAGVGSTGGWLPDDDMVSPRDEDGPVRTSCHYEPVSRWNVRTTGIEVLVGEVRR
jgi:hypothetical protein